MVAQISQVGTALPGAGSQSLQQRRRAAVSHAVGTVLPIYVQEASGGILRDVDGNQLIDFASGIAVTSVGNSDPRVVARVQEQVAKFTHTCFMITAYEPYVEVCEAAQRADPGRRGRSARRCSTPVPRPSRTPSRSPATPPGGRRWSPSTTPTTAEPT